MSESAADLQARLQTHDPTAFESQGILRLQSAKHDFQDLIGSDDA